MQVPTVRYRHKDGTVVTYNVSYVAMHLGEFADLERVGDSEGVAIPFEVAYDPSATAPPPPDDTAPPTTDDPPRRAGRKRSEG